MASILVGKQKLNKGTFIYFICLNVIGSEKSVLGDNPDDCCKLVLILIWTCYGFLHALIVQGM